jgi:hypothetical protein
MNSVIIYEVSENPEIVKRDLLSQGYFDSWYVPTEPNHQSYYLPYNTVWKPNVEINIALTELNRILENINRTRISPIRLIRCIILPSTPWGGIHGDPF